MTRAPKFADRSRTLLRNTLIDAAAELLRTLPWAEISMAEVASRAGVSRQTLYNEFGSREEFAQAYALREAQLFLARVEETLRADADEPEVALRKTFERFLRDAEQNPLVRAIVQRSAGGDELLALFTIRGGPVVDLATAHLTHVFEKLWPPRAAGDLRPLADVVVRLAISHASLPSGSAKQAARTIAALFTPALRSVLDR